LATFARIYDVDYGSLRSHLPLILTVSFHGNPLW
jgi:hypothetical protein